MRPKFSAACVVLAAFLFVPAISAQSNAPVQYFYDDVGRLTKVVDQSGNVATYA
jgi:hypothetical protein